MLVLSRKPTQSIVIDGHIIVTLMEIRGNRVQLGIEAPREIPVVRTELRSILENAPVPR
jgi:carbon storage regulator